MQPAGCRALTDVTVSCTVCISGVGSTLGAVTYTWIASVPESLGTSHDTLQVPALFVRQDTPVPSAVPEHVASSLFARNTIFVLATLPLELVKRAVTSNLDPGVTADVLGVAVSVTTSSSTMVMVCVFRFFQPAWGFCRLN